jgi:hypothetical protein
MPRAALFIVAALSFAGGASAAARVGDGEGALLTDVAAAALAGHQQLDVVTSRDLREVVEVEASKQMLGCSDEKSCLAEVAGAMGARYVVSGQLGALGERLVLTISVFDARQGSSSGRQALQADSIEALSAQVDPAVDRLVAGLALPAEGAREKVLVLDFKATASSTVVPPPPAPAAGVGPLLLVGGGAGVGLGALLAGVGGVLGALAWSADGDVLDAPTQVAAAEKLAARDALALGANVLYGIGATVAVVGAGVAVAGLFVDGGDGSTE